MTERAHDLLRQHLTRMTRTADDLAAAIGGHGVAVLVRRPDRTSWAPTEIICHLRDLEEMALLRLELIAAVDEPLIPAAGMGSRALGLTPAGHPAAPDRWASDRQYLRNDAREALEAFRTRRAEVLAHLGNLTGAEWRRGGLHPRLGRVSVEDIVAELARHDDVHLDQLRRALDGQA